MKTYFATGPIFQRMLVNLCVFISEPVNLFVGNLADSVKEKHLQKLFANNDIEVAEIRRMESKS